MIQNTIINSGALFFHSFYKGLPLGLEGFYGRCDHVEVVVFRVQFEPCFLDVAVDGSSTIQQEATMQAGGLCGYTKHVEHPKAAAQSQPKVFE